MSAHEAEDSVVIWQEYMAARGRPDFEPPGVAWKRLFGEPLDASKKELSYDDDGWTVHVFGGGRCLRVTTERWDICVPNGEGENYPCDPPKWLVDFSRRLVLAGTVFGALKRRCRMGFTKTGCWELILYPPVAEIVGGADDGARVVSSEGFIFDISGIFDFFDRTPGVAFTSNAEGECPYHGPVVNLLGEVNGRTVHIDIWMVPPHNAKPTVKIDPDGNVIGKKP